MSVREFVESLVPLSILTRYRQAKFSLLNPSLASPSCQSVFQEIYDYKRWGSENTASGPGSEIAETRDIREFLPKLLRRLEVKSILDAPCGDFSWMNLVDLSSYEYIGGDVVPAMIETNQRKYATLGRKFICVDLTKDQLPKADLVLCRDCLIHLSFKDAIAAARNIQRSGASYLLITTDPEVRANRPIRTGGFRPLNLHLPPFNFLPPLELFPDRRPPMDGEEQLIDPNKSLALYRLTDLHV